MKIIEILLTIPYDKDFYLPALTGSIAGYMDLHIIRAKAVTREIENPIIGSDRIKEEK